MHSRARSPEPLSLRRIGGRSRRRVKEGASNTYKDAFGAVPYSPAKLPFALKIPPGMRKLPPPLLSGCPPWAVIKSMLGEHKLGKSALLELRIKPKIGQQILERAGSKADVWNGFLHVSVGKVILNRSKDMHVVSSIIRNTIRYMEGEQPFGGTLNGKIHIPANKRMVIAEVTKMDIRAYRGMIGRLKRSGIVISGPIKHPHVTLCKFSASVHDHEECVIQAKKEIEERFKGTEEIRLEFHSLCLTAPSKANAVYDDEAVGKHKATRWRIAGGMLPENVAQEAPFPRKAPDYTKPCRFFKSPRGCIRGRKCYYKH